MDQHSIRAALVVCDRLQCPCHPLRAVRHAPARIFSRACRTSRDDRQHRCACASVQCVHISLYEAAGKGRVPPEICQHRLLQGALLPLLPEELSCTVLGHLQPAPCGFTGKSI